MYLLRVLNFFILVSVIGGLKLLVRDEESFLSAEIGSSLIFEMAMTEIEQFRFLSGPTIENPGSCILVNGQYCDCYDGFINQISISWKYGCIRARNEALLIGNKGLYFSVVLFANGDKISSEAIYLGHSQNLNHLQEKISLVLPLTLDDLPRSFLLLSSLQSVSSDFIEELIVITPDRQKMFVCSGLSGLLNTISISFPLRCISEQVLLPSSTLRFSGYGVQMAVKLLVSKIVRTGFYMTLDADILCLHPKQIENVIFRKEVGSIRGVYHFEDMTVHATWWSGSAQLLNISAHNLKHMETNDVGFGVTPALLSTYGSLLTIGEVCRQLHFGIHDSDSRNPLHSVVSNLPGSETFSSICDKDISVWISSLGFPPQGIIWSEYSLYRLTLEKFELFSSLHISEGASFSEVVSEDGQVDEQRGVYLHCNNVWYREQWPWNSSAAYGNQSCLFSVLQSTANIPTSFVLQLMQVES